MCVWSRGSQSNHGARSGRQAPRAGRRGARHDNPALGRTRRPRDTGAVTRELAEDVA
jgi:hypothetical protein